MFRTNNCSSSGGLYKQLTVYYHASLWAVWSLNRIVSATRLLTKIYDMIHLLTAIGLTPGGSSTVYIYTQYTEHNETEYTEQNIITIIHKHNNKNT